MKAAKERAEWDPISKALSLHRTLNTRGQQLPTRDPENHSHHQSRYKQKKAQTSPRFKKKKNLKFLKSLIDEIKNKRKVNKNREVLHLKAEMTGIILLH